MSNLKEVTASRFDAEVLASARPVLVDFWAEWCGPCKALAPVLEKVSEKFTGIVDFVKLNVDENPDVSKQYGIQGIPALLLFKDGQEIGRIVGKRSAVQLAAFLDAHVRTSTTFTQTATEARSTFGGDTVAKNERIASLKAHIARKLASPEESMWDGEISDALQFAAGTADQDECVRVLGLPGALVCAVGALSSYHGTHAAGAQFVADWLETVPVGADFSRVPTALLLQILESEYLSGLLSRYPDLMKIQARLMALHAADCDGERPPLSEWSAVRSECAVLAENAESWEQGALAKVLHSATYSLRVDETALETFLSAVPVFAWKKIQHDYNWTSEDERTFFKLMEQTGRQLKEQGLELRGPALLEKVAEIEPDLARRFRRQYEDGQRAVHDTGLSVCRMLSAQTALVH